jgi:hypothetical protein
VFAVPTSFLGAAAATPQLAFLADDQSAPQLSEISGRPQSANMPNLPPTTPEAKDGPPLALGLLISKKRRLNFALSRASEILTVAHPGS